MASFSSSSTVGIGGSHDLGGQEINDPVNVVDKPIFHWEKSIHALLVALASSVPPMITTDELRRAVENLEPISYMKWGYYDKWSAAIAVLLIERQIITEDDLNYEIEGESCLKEATKLFSVGDKVRVKIESSRLRWRRPHFRCPGYIFGMEGIVERYVGKFNDPFLLAFRGKGPKQHLYRVRFSMDDIWKSKYYGSVPPTCEHDSVDVEIYQDWLEFDPAFPRSSEINHEENVVVSSESEDQGTILEDNEDLSIFGDADEYARKEVLQSYQDHDHSHDHDHHHHDHDHGHIHEGVDYRTVKANSHSSRDEVEMIASFQEGEDSPGKIVGMALLRLLHKKGIVTFAQITENIDKLDAAGAELNGAALVARAWVDPAFKARLMTDCKYFIRNHLFCYIKMTLFVFIILFLVLSSSCCWSRNGYQHFQQQRSHPFGCG